MRLLEALEKIKACREKMRTESFHLFWVSGFTPLHLKTFTHAYLIDRLPQKEFSFEEGSFGDVLGSLRSGFSKNCDFCVLILEWGDLDPRLGLRNTGTWTIKDINDIKNHVSKMLSLLSQELQCIASAIPVVVSLPLLPLLPVHHGDARFCNSWELQLQKEIVDFSLRMIVLPQVKLVNPGSFTRKFSSMDQYDISSDISYGFPYTLPFADQLAHTLADAISPPPKVKGIITDLDDTLWGGILGDDGLEGISWSLDRKTQMHALYQKTLHSLGLSGILLAIASKNDADLVEDVFRKKDLLLPRDFIFPLEANWGKKSASIQRILNTWNIGEESVLFIDDNPREIEEVQSVFPHIQTCCFPSGKPEQIFSFLYFLREVCGKDKVLREDSLRMESLKKTSVSFPAAFVENDEGHEILLKESGSCVHISFSKDPSDQRAFELINKTNQFNSNGVRVSAKEWLSFLTQENSFVMKLSYEDKFGPLGKISVITGYVSETEIHVTNWVLSCRAFGRRIEYQALYSLFSVMEKDVVCIPFTETLRNAPFRGFLKSLMPSEEEVEDGIIKIYRTQFEEACPRLYHKIVVGD